MSVLRTLIVAFVVASLMTGLGVESRTVEAAGKPNIVMIYMDDFSPLPTWLWSNANRTPALARFANDGVWFKNAIGSTPRCCPGRANLLSGKYGHRTGVTRNDPSRINLRGLMNVKLRRNGYNAKFIGKYFNLIARQAPTRASMLKHAQGWDTFDIIWRDQGKFYDYPMYTKSRTLYFGRRATDHSSYVIGTRAAKHIRNAPKRKPLFMVVSLYDGHSPNLPMPRFEGHAKCANVKPWNGPAYNEHDVTDKPRYVRNTRKRKTDGYPLTKRCESMMNVNWVTAKVRAALKKTGRLDNTLFIFTADNGWVLGDHRLSHKNYPYSTPVPLYMLWPAKLDNQPRVVTEPVSNVDYYRTFCKLAGCTVPGSDGKNLLPLLLGETDRLGRSFIYEEMLHSFTGHPMPAWYGIRTTKNYSDTAWIYTEYRTGERELYNLTNDPHQLKNVIHWEKYADVRLELRRLLHNKVIRPNNVKYLSTLTNNG